MKMHGLLNFSNVTFGTCLEPEIVFVFIVRSRILSVYVGISYNNKQYDVSIFNKHIVMI